LFTLVMTTGYLAVGSVASLLHAPDPWTTAAVAAAICWAPGLLALAISALFPGPEMALFNMLVGMFVRMFVPLGVCLMIYARRGVLVDAGLVFYVLIFYMISLAIETGFLVRQLQTVAVER
jgi:hypothetical protein